MKSAVYLYLSYYFSVVQQKLREAAVKMTTLATEGGASEVINARRTESLDAPHILQLVQPWTEQLFGRVNVVDIM